MDDPYGSMVAQPPGGGNDPYASMVASPKAAKPPPAPVTAGGVAKAAGSGFLGGLLSDTPQGAEASGAKLGIDATGWLANHLGIPKEKVDSAVAALQQARQQAGFRTPDETQDQAHLYHAPQNEAERIANVAGAMAPNAIIPEGAAAKAASVILPTLGSEGARYATEKAGGGPAAQGVASAVGGVLGGAASGLRVNIPRGGSAAAHALEAEGVNLTPGQRYGGVALAAEDKAQSLPILGDAIRGARTRGRASFNRAVANRALAPIGETLPAEVQPGTDTVAHVEQRLGDAYTRANAMITNVTPDDEFNNAVAAIGGSLKTDAPSVRGLFNKLVKDQVTERFASGPLHGDDIQSIKQRLGELAADNAGGNGGERTLSRKLSAVADEITALAGRSNPGYVMAQRAADRGWANFVRMRNAGSRTGTDNGVFTPAQLKQAVRAEDASVGKGATARGSATLSDLANNATSVMNQNIPNSGTTDRLLLAGLAGSAAAPGHVGIPVAAGLSVAAVPYLIMGRRIATAALKADASPELIAASAKRLEVLSHEEPKLAPVYKTVLQRLRDAAPVAASSAALTLNGAGAPAQQDQQ